MKGLILLILSLVIGATVIPFTFAYALITIPVKNVFMWWKWRYPVRSLIVSMIVTWKDLSQYFYNASISVDQAGNTVGYKFFNDVLIRPYTGNKFGDPDETISSVLGKNEQIGGLTRAGRILNRVLNWIDPGHSKKAIERTCRK